MAARRPARLEADRLTGPGLRVAHVAQPEHSGVPVVVLALAEHQLAAGWEVSVHAPPDTVLAAGAVAVGARHVPWAATRGPGRSTVAETRRLARALAAVDPDVVHLHSSKAGLAGRLALRGRRATVFQPHAWSFVAVGGAGRRLATGWERLGTRWADAVVCVSDDERAAGARAGVGGRFTVVPNGVDVEHFAAADAAARAAARAALGLPPAPLVVLLGRASPQKGTDTMLAAWPAIRRAVPGASLALVGHGYEADAAADGVIRAGLQADVRPWLAAADVVALPSRWEAGLSLAAMEAMATARSVVLTDTWGARSAAGAVVPVGDAAALATAVTERLRDPDRAAAEGLAGRARMERDFDCRAAARRMDAVYAEVRRRRGEAT